jgi:putative heme-binding domain-containing protein
VADAVRRIARRDASARVRVQALWTLAGLDALTPEDVEDGIRYGAPEVREHAVQLSERFPDQEIASVKKCVTDSAERVRYQLAFTLGERNDSWAAEALMKLVADENEDVANAALSSAPRHAKAMLSLAEQRASEPRIAAALPMLRKLVQNPPSLAPSTMTVIERTNALSAAQRAERAQVLSRYEGVGRLKGDAVNGAGLFRQNCAQCHRLRGEGMEVGPDLGMMAGKPVEQLVVGILDPNAAMEARYQSFTAVKRDDEELTGIIVAETPTTLTLRAPNKPDETILRHDLKALTAGGLSLMPEGLESAFTPQQLADLIAYVVGR